MSSPEVITRIKELTTPPQGEGDVSYALVIPANKGSYEPQWITGINQFKQTYTPNGVFEASAASPMYSAKKYCESGNVQLLCVRPNTGALMAGTKVLYGSSQVNFESIGLSESSVKIGETVCFNSKAYFAKNNTTVPTAKSITEMLPGSDKTIFEQWLETYFVEIPDEEGNKAEIINTLIDFTTTSAFKCGTTLFFEVLPKNANFEGVTTYPAYFAALPQSTLQVGDEIFGWYANEEGQWKFGYAQYTEDTSGEEPIYSFVPTVTPVFTEGAYVLEKDVISASTTFFAKSQPELETDYDYLANIQVQTKAYSYSEIKATGIFIENPEAGSEMFLGDGLWFAGTPYICNNVGEGSESVIILGELDAKWVNVYFRAIGKPMSNNFIPWEEGVNQISEYTQETKTSEEGQIIADGSELFTVYAENGGDWGNKASFSIINYEDDPDDIEVPGCFIITFFYNGVQTEKYTVTRLEGIKDANGNSMYIEDVVNKRSADFRVKDNKALDSSLLPNTVINPVSMGGGANRANGSTSANPTDAQMIKALNLMLDEAKYPLFAVGDGGYATRNYAKAIVSFVNQRKGTKGILCVPATASVASSMSKAYNNIVEYMVDLNISDTKIRVEEYWGYEYDADTGKNVLIPPDGCYIRNEALTKRNEGLYYPNAGWSNGVIDVDLVNKWDKGYRDLLDKARVNYAKYDRNRGTCIFSEQTSYAQPSYRQQDHIEKVLLDMIPKSDNILEGYLLRLAEPGVFNEMKYELDAMMKMVQNGHGCSWFEVTISNVNNSQTTLDAQEVNVWIEFTPISAIKRIILTYALTNQAVRMVDITTVA